MRRGDARHHGYEAIRYSRPLTGACVTENAGLFKRLRSEGRAAERAAVPVPYEQALAGAGPPQGG